jgi:predicted metal-dependent peptidase
MQVTKLMKAKTQVLRRHPGKSLFIIPVPFISINSDKGKHVGEMMDQRGMTRTMATDHFNIYYDDNFIESLSIPEIVYVLLHEGTHRQGMHALRLGSRDPVLWNVATDYSINNELDDVYIPGIMQKWKEINHQDWADNPPVRPKIGLYDKRYTFEIGADKIYNMLKNDFSNDKNKGNGDGEGEEDGDLDILVAPNKEDGETQSQYEARISREATKVAMDLAKSAEIAKKAGLMTADLERYVNELTEPKVQWYQHLSEYMIRQISEKETYSYRRPNKRMMANRFDFIMPSYDGIGLPYFATALDTSGSMGMKTIQKSLSEFNDIIEQFNVRTKIVYSDYGNIKGVEEFGPEDTPIEAHPVGGGGTSFKPFFKWIDEQQEKPMFAIYFTDLYGDFPDEEPDYPVLWVTESTGVNVPFGEILYIND